MVKLDFLMDTDDDLLIQNGDFVIDNGELQQVKIILNADKGGLRQFPLLGASMSTYIGSSNNDDILSNIIVDELNKDGFVVDTIDIERDINGSITTDVKIV